jgi:hypothetical protein
MHAITFACGVFLGRPEKRGRPTSETWKNLR